MFRELQIAVVMTVLLLLQTSTGFAQTEKRIDLDPLDNFGDDSGPLKPGNRWALIIGIDRYSDDEIRPLNFAAKDAEALYQVLIDPNVGLFPPENVILLTTNTDNEELKPTKVNILYYLNDWLISKVEKEDTVVLFFSGHGMVYKERTYLLPMDINTRHTPAYAIENQEFERALRDLKAKRVLAFLDSCHSGGVLKAKGGVDAILAPDSYSILPKLPGQGRIVFASCGKDQSSFEWDEKGHGVFTYYLLEALKGSANPLNPVVTFSDIRFHVEKMVAEWVKDHGAGKNQKPIAPIMEEISGEIPLAFNMKFYYKNKLNEMKKALRSWVGPSHLQFGEAATIEDFLDLISDGIDQNRNELSRIGEDALLRIVDFLNGKRDPETFRRLDMPIVKEAMQKGLWADPTTLPEFPPSKFVASTPATGGQISPNGTLTMTFDNPPASVTVNRQPATMSGKTATWQARGLTPGKTVYLNVAWKNRDGSDGAGITIRLTVLSVQSRPSVQYGTLRVNVLNTRADVYLDGVEVGKIPYRNKKVEAGRHTLMLKSPGYETLTEEIEVPPNGDIMVKKTLKKRR